MDIEVKVTMASMEEIEAEIDRKVKEARRKMLSGEIEPDPPEVEPCDCVGCSPHLGPEIPCEREADGTGEK